MVRIFAIGEIVLDFVMKDGKPLAAVPGGSSFNSLVSMARTCPDAEFYMVSQIGDDYVSSLVVDFMTENGISPKYLSHLKGTQTPVSLAALDSRNNATYEFFRDSSTHEFSIEPIQFTESDIVLFGSFFAVSPSTSKQVKALLGSARNAGATVYYDINFRKNHLLQLPELKASIEENISLCTILRASLEDIYNVYGTEDIDEIYKSHVSPKEFICTNDSKSVFYYDGSSKQEFVPSKIETVSTIGAGDNFNAGYIYALLTQKSRIPTAIRFSQNVCQSLFNYVDKDFRP